MTVHCDLTVGAFGGPIGQLVAIVGKPSIVAVLPPVTAMRGARYADKLHQPDRAAEMRVLSENKKHVQTRAPLSATDA